MPEFILNNTRTNKRPHLTQFEQGYVEAMFFTNGDTGDARENLLNEMGTERLTRAALLDIKRDCEAFLSTIMPDGCFVQQWLGRAADGYDDQRAGIDLWFTRQGHGVGYWERDELKADGLGDGLSDASKKLGEAYVEVSRGWIYHA
jgi:hypothetical protein